jgi:hypothetical protein
MPKLSEILFGKKDKVKQLKTTNPLQDQLMQLINEGLTSGEGPFGDLFGSFDEDSFNKGVTEPALKNFKENILPMLQEKFIAGNQVLGSGLQNAQVKAAGNLQDQLAQLMYQAQQGQQQNKLAGINSLLGRNTFENVYKQGSTGLVPGVLQGATQGLGQGFGNKLGSIAG